VSAALDLTIGPPPATSDVERERDELRARIPSALLGVADWSERAELRMLAAARRLEGGEFRSKTARVLMRTRHGVEIGAYSYGECFVPGAFPPGTVVGRYVSIAEGVRAFGRNHPMDRLSMHPYFFNKRFGFLREDAVPFAGLDVGHDAWIGLRAIVTPSCRRIGLGAVVAAGAVVTSDVPDFAVVAGVPARVMKHRFPEDVREAVKKSRWWELPVEVLASHMDAMHLGLASGIARHPLLAEGGARKNPERSADRCA